MTEGTIASLNDKGFGFIKIEGRRSNLFFHAKDLVGVRFDDLRENDKMRFASIDKNEKGEAAKEVELVEEAPEE